MSTFEVKVRKIEISAHPDPETTSLEVGKVDNYNVVVGKGQYKTGDLVVYIPEAALIPDALLEEMNLVGRLAGSGKNRVKAIKLRKVLSQGLCYSIREGWIEGQDVGEELGIKKWVPVVPAHMAGDVQRAVLYNCDRQRTETSFKFDIENIKSLPWIFQTGEDVTITEKIHGTFIVIGLIPEDARHPDMINGKFFVSSKGLAKQGLFMKDNERNVNNLYVKTAKNLDMDLLGKLEQLATSNKVPTWLVGEVFGNGIQDLRYGQEGTTFRAFGVKIDDSWINYDDFLFLCYKWKIPTVPVLYRGPYSVEKVAELTDGPTVEGKGCHLREGVVICATESEYNGGRKILKSVSEKYLLRKGEQTEFE